MVPRYGLNENVPHRLMYLNVLSPVDGTTWEGSGSVTLLEEIYFRGRLKFEIPKAHAISSYPSVSHGWIKIYAHVYCKCA